MAKWIDRPYGRKLEPSRTDEDGNIVTLIRIRPNYGTAASVKQSDICHLHHGLRTHPDTEWEHVEHRGYVGKELTGYVHELHRSLAYLFLPFSHTADDVPVRMEFAKGGRFYSVLNDTERTGESHRLANVGEGTIELKLTVKQF